MPAPTDFKTALSVPLFAQAVRTASLKGEAFKCFKRSLGCYGACAVWPGDLLHL